MSLLDAVAIDSIKYEHSIPGVAHIDAFCNQPQVAVKGTAVFGTCWLHLIGNGGFHRVVTHN